ncbi:MAG: AI-2E family transporter [Candidatus Gracilibacteria bacterium]|jgi:predicted PurR-regulated permease PerM
MNNKVKSPSRANESNPFVIEKLSGYFLIFTLVVAFYYLFQIVWPFLTAIFLAAVLTAIFYPVYKRIVKLFRGRERLASLVSMLIVVIVLIVPVAGFGLMVSGQGISAYENVNNKIASGELDSYLQWSEGGFFYDLKEKVKPIVDLDKIDIKQTIVNAVKYVSTFVVSQTANLLAGVSSLFLNFIIMIFSMYFFFKDGDKLVQKIGHYCPFPKVYEDELFSKLNSMVKAIMFGVVLTALVQGALGGLGFFIVGINSPVFWGAIMAFLSLIPLVGTTGIWLPAAIYLLVTGHYFAGIFIILWGILVVGTSDNIIRPYFIGSRAKTYPLLTFLVILGGIFSMGFKGIIVGPMVLMVIMSLLHIYEAEYIKVLKR